MPVRRSLTHTKTNERVPVASVPPDVFDACRGQATDSRAADRFPMQSATSRERTTLTNAPESGLGRKFIVRDLPISLINMRLSINGRRITGLISAHPSVDSRVFLNQYDWQFGAYLRATIARFGMIVRRLSLVWFTQ